MAIMKSWNIPYQGTSHHKLLESLNKMKAENTGRRDKAYENIATIIQSSGFGKSRMALEMSDLVFTFPFNLRNPSETTNGLLICDGMQCIQ